MGQSSVILAFAATVLIAVIIIGSQQSNQATEVDLAAYHNSVLAREASMTGVNLTVRRLVDEPDQWFSNTSSYEYASTQYGSSSFSVSVASTHPDSVSIISIGTQHGVNHRIEAIYAKGLISGGLPEVFSYALVAEDELRLNGNTEIMSANGANNANIHANDNLRANGNTVHVEGYGTSVTSPNITPASKINNVFDPNDDSNGAADNAFTASAIDIPEFDPALYSTSPPADLVIPGNYSMTSINRAWLNANGYGAEVGTKDHPFLIYVGGNLTASGTVVIDNLYTQFVVAGSMTLSGSVASSATPLPAANASQAAWDAYHAANLDAAAKTQIGYFIDGDITFNGDISIVGELYTNGTVNLNGGGNRRRNVLGAIVSSTSDIVLNGGITIQYAQLSTTGLIEEFFNDTPEGVRLVDWAEF